MKSKIANNIHNRLYNCKDILFDKFCDCNSYQQEFFCVSLFTDTVYGNATHID